MSAHRSNAALGAWGERLAATHYRRRGYDVVDRNWRCAAGELDLVLRLGRTYVFSEVKTRRNEGFGHPAEAVGVRKQQRIRRLAFEWLRENDLHGVDIRFDVVAITGVEVVVIENAF
jgi:putative endonuclease